jgi:chromosome segregation ATPase
MELLCKAYAEGTEQCRLLTADVSDSAAEFYATREQRHSARMADLTAYVNDHDMGALSRSIKSWMHPIEALRKSYETSITLAAQHMAQYTITADECTQRLNSLYEAKNVAVVERTRATEAEHARFSHSMTPEQQQAIWGSIDQIKKEHRMRYLAINNRMRTQKRQHDSAVESANRIRSAIEVLSARLRILDDEASVCRTACELIGTS